MLLNDLIVQQEIFRSRIKMEDGKASILITDEKKITVPLCFEDISKLSATEQDAYISTFYQEKLNTPFDLQKESWLRMGLFKLSRNKQVLIWITHHIAADYRSCLLMQRNLWMLYQHHATSVALPSLTCPIQYVDFAAWQRKSLTAKNIQVDLSYWKSRLCNYTRLKLPVDKNLPLSNKYEEGILSLNFPEAFYLRISEVAQLQEVTVFAFLLSAISILLARYCQQCRYLCWN